MCPGADNEVFSATLDAPYDSRPTTNYWQRQGDILLGTVQTI